MGVTTMKYGVSVNFCPKLTIFGKIVGHIWILSKNTIFSKLVKTHISDCYV
jgi:hypothetical protein